MIRLLLNHEVFEYQELGGLPLLQLFANCAIPLMIGRHKKLLQSIHCDGMKHLFGLNNVNGSLHNRNTQHLLALMLRETGKAVTFQQNRSFAQLPIAHLYKYLAGLY